MLFICLDETELIHSFEVRQLNSINNNGVTPFVFLLFFIEVRPAIIGPKVQSAYYAPKLPPALTLDCRLRIRPSNPTWKRRSSEH